MVGEHNIIAEASDVAHSIGLMGVVDPLMYKFAIFILAIFIGYYVIWSVTPALHTPLMSVTNAISSVIIVGALLAIGTEFIDNQTNLNNFYIAKGLGFFALILASINIFGGFYVTYRMLAMYKKKVK
jgi:NAD(P) transhydrogenase subunit alpha|tara:strand:- start:3299 stop:3679 length:381 start_codon:yes stop_codon:yes gene_type:complete